VILVYPGENHPIFIEWRKWRRKQEHTWTKEGSEAMESIQTIANHIYPDGCVVGHMIMKDDLLQMEEEAAIEEQAREHDLSQAIDRAKEIRKYGDEA
jgi:hypothetical protein